MSHNLWQLNFDKAQLAFHVSQFWLYGNEYYLSQMICLWTEFLQSKTFFHFASLPTLNKIRHWNSWRKIYFHFGSKFSKILLIIVIKSLLLKSSARVHIRCLQPSTGSWKRGFSRKYLFMSIYIKVSSRHKAALYVFWDPNVIILNVAISWVCCQLQLVINRPGCTLTL